MFQQINAVQVYEVSATEGFADQNKSPNTLQS